MGDFDQRQLLANAVPLIAVILMASGIVVKTLPLESKRPVESSDAKIAHAGRQDVDARLWQDPFVVMRDVDGKTPADRCVDASDDRTHHPNTLRKSLQYTQKRRGHLVTVMPVFVPGGPYSQDSEFRRRTRYAAVMALLNTGWEPSDEEKLGFVWTFESCVNEPWSRHIPELLPYEWFRKEDSSESLLVLWIDEDAVSHRPLRGMQSLSDLIQSGSDMCDAPEWPDQTGGGSAQGRRTFQSDVKMKLCPVKTASVAAATGVNSAGASTKATNTSASVAVIGSNVTELASVPIGTGSLVVQVISKPAETGGDADKFEGQSQQETVQWQQTIVLGPWSSKAMFSLVDELAKAQTDSATFDCRHSNRQERSSDGTPCPRFYSSSATARVDDGTFRDALAACRKRKAQSTERKAQDNEGLSQDNERKPPDTECEADVDSIEDKFHERVVRLNATDDRLTGSLVKELMLRLVATTPLEPGHEALCEGTVVIVAEGDTSYARAFRDEFDRKLGDEVCGQRSGPAVVQVGYLRGLDGLIPGAGTDRSAGTGTQQNPRPSVEDAQLMQATLERADGLSQYDYLRRLADHLRDLDRSERKSGRHGVAAIGILGNDAYDKILVLDALRERFPRAVFFAADLDARLLDERSIRSTRNLIVASGFGLTLHDGLQGSAPPFRDTYQTGTYLSTLVALNATASQLDTRDFEPWFRDSRLYEIGRSRAVNLVGARSALRGPEACTEPNPSACRFVHSDEDWRNFDPLPSIQVTIVVLLMSIGVAGLAFMLSRRARAVMRGARLRATTAGPAPVALVVALFVTGLYVIHFDVLEPAGEPFAWLEGVSVWPTQIIGMVVLVVTLALLVYGRLRLRKNIDDVANRFGLRTLRECEMHSGKHGIRGLVRHVRRLLRPDVEEGRSGAGARTVDEAWVEFVEYMCFPPSAVRVALATLLFLILGIAFMALDWPNSPHRGVTAAWFNHGLLFALIGAVSALLFAALDASVIATRFLGRILRADPGPELLQAAREDGAAVNSVSEGARGNWTRFRLAVDVASAVNRLVYLPFVALLLVAPVRSRVFDSWDFSLPYGALLLVSLIIAARCAMALRRQAARLRTRVLSQIEGEADRHEIDAKLGATSTDQTRGRTTGLQDTPLALQAELLRRMAGEIRAAKDGPFRPLSQEPVVRGILLVLGGTGGITTAEFLFLSR